jgi:carbohydrate diacid regulator
MAQEIRKTMAQQIVDSIKEVCSCDINYINSRGIIFASTDAKRIGDFHEIGMKVVRTGQTIEVETDNSFFGTQKGVNIPIVYNHEVIAAVGLTGVPAQVRKYAQLAQRVTALLLREQELEARDYSQRSQLSYVVRALTTNLPIQHSYVTQLLEQYQIDPEGLFCTIVIETGARASFQPDTELEWRIRQVFGEMGARLYSFEPPREHLLILEQERLRQGLPALRQLAQETQGRVKLGIGTPRELMQQYRSYTAAKVAVNSLFGTQSMAIFEELDLEIVLGTVPKESQRYFVEKILSGVTEKDRELLQSYYGCDMSLKQTCEVMYLHKNTLQYQLDRIWRSTGYNPRSFRDAVVLYTALKLEAIR